MCRSFELGAGYYYRTVGTKCRFNLRQQIKSMSMRFKKHLDLMGIGRKGIAAIRKVPEAADLPTAGIYLLVAG